MAVHKGGYLIAEMRKAKGWSQKELAQKAGMSQSHLSSIEKGTSQPTAPILERLAGALGFTMDEFFEGKKL